MITEDYVNFEIAKLLKEKGFDEGCSFVVNAISKGVMPVSWPTTNSDIEDEKASLIALPTLQMACRWLTAVHNLFITFELDFSDGAYPMFDAVVYNLATCKKYPIINYDRYSYIKGTEAAIKYCLENLI